MNIIKDKINNIQDLLDKFSFSLSKKDIEINEEILSQIIMNSHLLQQYLRESKRN